MVKVCHPGHTLLGKNSWTCKLGAEKLILFWCILEYMGVTYT